jgi:hypothetical protein
MLKQMEREFFGGLPEPGAIKSLPSFMAAQYFQHYFP